MKSIITILACISLLGGSAAHAERAGAPNDMHMVAPALERFLDTTMVNGV